MAWDDYLNTDLGTTDTEESTPSIDSSSNYTSISDKYFGSDLDTTDSNWDYSFYDRISEQLMNEFGSIWKGVSLISDKLGFEGARDWASERGDKLFEEAAALQVDHTSLSDAWEEKSPTKFLQWGAEALTSLGTSVAEVAMTGGLGAAAAGGKVGASLVSREMAGSMLRKNTIAAAKELGEDAAVAEVRKLAYTNTAKQIGRVAGGLSVEGVHGAAQASVTEIEEKGYEDASLLRPAVVGLFTSVISKFSPVEMAAAKGTIGKLANKSWGSVATTMVKEGSEELAQDMLQVAHKAGIDPTITMQDALNNPDVRWALAESFLAGSIGGAAFGVMQQPWNKKGKVPSKEEATEYLDRMTKAQKGELGKPADLVTPDVIPMGATQQITATAGMLRQDLARIFTGTTKLEEIPQDQKQLQETLTQGYTPSTPPTQLSPAELSANIFQAKEGREEGPAARLMSEENIKAMDKFEAIANDQDQAKAWAEQYVHESWFKKTVADKLNQEGLKAITTAKNRAAVKAEIARLMSQVEEDSNNVSSTFTTPEEKEVAKKNVDSNVVRLTNILTGKQDVEINQTLTSPGAAYGEALSPVATTGVETTGEDGERSVVLATPSAEDIAAEREALEKAGLTADQLRSRGEVEVNTNNFIREKGIENPLTIALIHGDMDAVHAELEGYAANSKTPAIANAMQEVAPIIPKNSEFYDKVRKNTAEAIASVSRKTNAFSGQRKSDPIEWSKPDKGVQRGVHKASNNLTVTIESEKGSVQTGPWKVTIWNRDQAVSEKSGFTSLVDARTFAHKGVPAIPKVAASRKGKVEKSAIVSKVAEEQRTEDKKVKEAEKKAGVPEDKKVEPVRNPKLTKAEEVALIARTQKAADSRKKSENARKVLGRTPEEEDKQLAGDLEERGKSTKEPTPESKLDIEASAEGDFSKWDTPVLKGTRDKLNTQLELVHKNMRVLNKEIKSAEGFADIRALKTRQLQKELQTRSKLTQQIKALDKVINQRNLSKTEDKRSPAFILKGIMDGLNKSIEDTNSVIKQLNESREWSGDEFTSVTIKENRVELEQYELQLNIYNKLLKDYNATKSLTDIYNEGTDEEYQLRKTLFQLEQSILDANEANDKKRERSLFDKRDSLLPQKKAWTEVLNNLYSLIEKSKLWDAETKTKEGLKKDGIENVHDLLTWVSKQKNTPVLQQAFARVVLSTVPKRKLNSVLVVVADTDIKNTSYYNNGTVFIHPNHYGKADTYLHEAVHAFTVEEMTLNKNLSNKMEALRKHVLNYLKDHPIYGKDAQSLLKWEGENPNTDPAGGHNALNNSYTPRKNWYYNNRDRMKDADIMYGLMHPYEFVSQTFGSESFRTLLADIPPTENFSASNWIKNLMNQFVDIIRQLFKGASPKYNSVLFEIISTSVEIGQFRKERVSTVATEAMTDEVREKHEKGLEDYINLSSDRWEDAKKYGNTIARMGQKYFRSITSILMDASPVLVSKIRGMEYEIRRKTMKRHNEIAGFVKLLKKIPNSKKKAEIYYQLFNPTERNTKESLENFEELLESVGLWQEYVKIQFTLDSIRREAKTVGLDEFSDIEGYFPRFVKDVDGLIKAMKKEGDDYGKIQQAVDAAYKFTGNQKPTEDQITSTVINILKTGRWPSFLRVPTSAKKRTVNRVLSKYMQFYGRPEDALVNHVFEMTEAIEGRKFIGITKQGTYQKRYDSLLKELNKESTTEERQEEIAGELDTLTKLMTDTKAQIDQSVSYYVAKLVKEGKLKGEDEGVVASALRARLTQKGMHGPMSHFRDVGLITSLGSFMSTMTQLNDVIHSIFEYGLGTTAGALMSKKTFAINDLDLGHVMTELSSSPTSRIVDTVLTWSGFKGLDGFLKATTMEAAIQNARSMDRKSFFARYEKLFGEKTEGFYEATHAPKLDKNSKFLRFFAFYELSGIQPISMSEMPIGYNTAGNGRILYTLKSYNLKIANRLYDQIKRAWSEDSSSEQKRQAMYQFATYAALLVLSGAGVDELKDWITGKEKPFSENVNNNMLKLFFMSRYTLDKGFRDGVASTLLKDVLAPPVSWIDSPISDASNWVQGESSYKSLKLIPIGGKIIYEWTPKGREVELKQRKEYINDLIRGTVTGEETWATVRKYISEYNRDAVSFNKGLSKGTDTEKITLINATSISRVRKAEIKKNREENR